MKKTSIILLGIIGSILLIMLVVGGILASSYNTLIRKEESVNNSLAQVETQYQRRFDLYDSVARVVKAALQQEQDVFGDIAEARTRYSGATSVQDKENAIAQGEVAFGRLLAVVESYPNLQSNQNIRDFQVQIEGTENRIAVARKDYNDVVTDFNTHIRSFPNNMFANMFGYSTKEYIQIEEESRSNPRIDLELN